MPVESLSLLAAFLVGLAGSVHCLAMCGGISGALSLRAQGQGASALRVATQSATHQLGRVLSYAIAGGVIGGMAGAIPELLHSQALTLTMRALAGLVLIGASIGVLTGWRPLARLEQVGARVWRRLAPLSQRIDPAMPGGQLLIGMLWGWLPCGMVYSMLMVAALSGGTIRGAATMLCFGGGTLPAVFAAGLAGAQVWRLNRVRPFKAVLGSLLLILGIVTALAPWTFSVHATR